MTHDPGSHDPGLRAAALEALGRQPDRDLIDRVARAHLTDPDPLVRGVAAGLVAWLRRPGYVDALMPLTTDPAGDVRSVVTLRLGMGRDPAAVPLLQVMTGDPDDRIRRSAVLALRHLTAG
ncbi:HEAT repeat domain-containing protein [Actinoplanes subglobosus]|uniref:HEAT repeat domain-containing protein n=1 Tax=Actinoplanes subglobosus TaxID=1547892 RepID=A0ABV8IVZ6_9ACTN